MAKAIVTTIERKPFYEQKDECKKWAVLTHLATVVGIEPTMYGIKSRYVYHSITPLYLFPFEVSQPGNSQMNHSNAMNRIRTLRTVFYRYALLLHIQFAHLQNNYHIGRL